MAVRGAIRLFLCGDVMAGRGIDQIMPTPVDPQLHEPYVRSARDYVALAQRRHGPLPTGVAPAYIWGEALEILRRAEPDARIVNLETAVTTSDAWQDKGINYRMHPAHVDCLRAAGIDVCTLANNHVLDWGRPGLLETLEVLQGAGIATAGAGVDGAAAAAPAVLPRVGGGRLLVFAGGHRSSGIDAGWAAGAGSPGVNLLGDFAPRTLRAIAAQVKALRRRGDLVLYAVHWGGNWGYTVPDAQRRFAHGLIDRAGVDVVCGHSSHHAKGIEVYGDRLILYGCGDLINDYEGISGHGEYRPDLRLLFFPELDNRGALRRLAMVVLRAYRFALHRAEDDDQTWMTSHLAALCRPHGGSVEGAGDGTLQLRW